MIPNLYFRMIRMAAGGDRMVSAEMERAAEPAIVSVAQELRAELWVGKWSLKL